MNRIVASLLSLMLAASIWSMPASALERGDTGAAEGCAAGGDIDSRMLLVAYTDNKMLPAAPEHSRTDSGGENTAGKRDSAPASANGEAPPDNVLSQLEPNPGSLKVAARAAGDGQPEEWLRLADSPVPEPGIWAVLIAGFLGICAVARPRIFSS